MNGFGIKEVKFTSVIYVMELQRGLVNMNKPIQEFNLINILDKLREFNFITENKMRKIIEENRKRIEYYKNKQSLHSKERPDNLQEVKKQ